MNRHRVLVWVISGINLISPLLPVLAIVNHQRSRRYRHLPWMNRLAICLVYSMLVNWGMVGLALNQIRNAWFGNGAYLLESLLTLWVLSDLDSRPLPRSLLWFAGSLVLLSGVWEVFTVGFTVEWLRMEMLAGLIIGSLCLWRLMHTLLQDDYESTWRQPAFWLLGSWSLWIGVELMFSPLHNFFLQRLSGDWVVVPWFAKYVIVLFLNLGVARTFLCPKPSSS